MGKRADMGVMGDFCAQVAMQRSGRAIEIAALFDDTILDVRYLSAMTAARTRKKSANDNAYTIGSQSHATFHLCARAAEHTPFALVRPAPGDNAHELCFTSDMVGDVSIGEQTLTLAQLQSYAHRANDNAFAWTIPSGARCRVTVGNNEFFVNAVEPPQRQPVAFTIDWREQLYLFGVLGGAMVLLALAWMSPPNAHSLSVDDLLSDERFLNITVKPPVEELLEQARGASLAGATGGAARHDGQNGEMGDPDLRRVHSRYKQLGPKDNPNPKPASLAAQEAAKQAGILGMLAMTEQSMVGGAFSDEHAFGRDTVNVIANLTGNDNGPSGGYAGLGDHGLKSGGGGDSPDTIGSAKIGRIGAGPGDSGPGGRYHPGIASLVGSKTAGPDVTPAVVVLGSLDKSIIRRVVRSHMAEIKFCYERELAKNAELYGRVLVGFTISPEGRVVSSTVEKSTMNNPTAESCMAGAVARWEFPRPQGGIVSVSYPFVLHAAGAND